MTLYLALSGWPPQQSLDMLVCCVEAARDLEINVCFGKERVSALFFTMVGQVDGDLRGVGRCSE